MSRNQFYYQCLLSKRIDAGIQSTVSWIPETFARQGGFVKLKSEDGTWVDGWKVSEVGAKRDAAYVESHEMDHRRQRKASDI